MKLTSRISIVIASIAILACSVMAANTASAGFEKLKALVGEWEAQTKDGKTHVYSYKLIASGSVVQEDYRIKGQRGAGC